MPTIHIGFPEDPDQVIKTVNEIWWKTEKRLQEDQGLKDYIRAKNNQGMIGVDSLKELQTIIHEQEEEHDSDTSSVNSKADIEKGIPIESEMKDQTDEDEEHELLSEQAHHLPSFSLNQSLKEQIHPSHMLIYKKTAVKINSEWSTPNCWSKLKQSLN